MDIRNTAVLTMNAQELADYLNSGTWDVDACVMLCKLAGLEEEWNAAEDLEPIVFKAAEKLGVKIC